MQFAGDKAGQPGPLSEEEIARRLKEYQPAFHEKRDFSQDTLRPAGVLVPLVFDQDQWHLLFTRRAETVQSHKGQVSFPGGASDDTDRSPEETALRETHEEIGVPCEEVRVLGRLDYLATVTNYLITPVVGCIPWPYEFRLSPHEVSRVFTIPLVWLANRAHWELRPFQRRVGYYEDVIYYQNYDGETLWGATARMTVEFLKALRLID